MHVRLLMFSLAMVASSQAIATTEPVVPVTEDLYSGVVLNDAALAIIRAGAVSEFEMRRLTDDLSLANLRIAAGTGREIMDNWWAGQSYMITP